MHFISSKPKPKLTKLSWRKCASCASESDVGADSVLRHFHGKLARHVVGERQRRAEHRWTFNAAHETTSCKLGALHWVWLLSARHRHRQQHQQKANERKHYWFFFFCAKRNFCSNSKNFKTISSNMNSILNTNANMSDDGDENALIVFEADGVRRFAPFGVCDALAGLYFFCLCWRPID